VRGVSLHAARNQHRWYRKPALVGPLMLAVIAAAVFGVLFWRHSRTRVSTDDAYIDAAAERVSPRVAGRVLRVAVDDNDEVQPGQLLLELDPSDYQSQSNQALADQARANAQLAQAQARPAAAQAQLEQARANVAVAGADANNTAVDLRRTLELRKGGSVSQQAVDNATNAAKEAAARLEAAQKAARAAEAAIRESAAQIQAARAEITAAAARVELAGQNLSYTQVRAGLAGRVTAKNVATGNYVQPGLQLMVIVPRDVYVTANFKETQLAHMRPQQPAKIHVDAYPDVDLRGHVDSLQAASGQAFSALPPQNATGNWVKIVQRVPVKVVIDGLPSDPAKRLGPGMSAKVTVKVR
jgi:membrane fusion protein (multidrug efflux system)